MVKVKICGITNTDDAVAAAESGADAIGLIFVLSPRRVTPTQARNIVSHLPPDILKIGVFADHGLTEVKDIMAHCRLDFAQLHGSESPDYCTALGNQAIKAFRIKDESILQSIRQYHTCAYLLDSYSPDAAGGTGCTFNWDIAVRAKEFGKIILSGGLTPENVAEAIARVQPAAVDVSSGIESSPGKKDHDKLRAFIDAAKSENPK
ncbi:MAG: phosphoribosylanthranilate isomerase [Chloroflexota bacterium]